MNPSNESSLCIVSTHSHPKVAALDNEDESYDEDWVSTHSHPKVAAGVDGLGGLEYVRFNTQPPEGGCACLLHRAGFLRLFQHTATRRWLPYYLSHGEYSQPVSTHSHPKVAAHTDGIS